MKRWIPAFAGMTVLLFIGTAGAQVRSGIDELERSNFALLEGRNVALITNQTGVNAEGESTVDVLRRAKRVNLICVMSPEHGFRGTIEHGQNVSDSSDTVTGLPFYSLYGATTRPTDKMLEGVDTIVFDMQDIGTRFYTYITTMGMALEEAARHKIWFVVLDRPNPIRGDIMEGDVLDADIKRMTGYFEIPVRHGLTVGELARWMNRVRGFKAAVKIVPVKRWRRSLWFDETGLPFVPPSPNIRSLTGALVYPGIGCFEATNVSVGRGTDTPFELFGAPWINGKALCARLREKNFPGVLFEPVTFTPKADLYEGQSCGGVRIIVTNRNTIRPFRIFLEAFRFIAEEYAKDFKPEWEEVRVVTGSNALRQAVEGKISFEDLFVHYDQAVATFYEHITPFYLY